MKNKSVTFEGYSYDYENLHFEFTRENGEIHTYNIFDSEFGPMLSDN
ncbi:MAG: hypothetical protein LBC44_00780 [Mycoplasmataceae bacterium]|jgi:hypothetical protein|nr:hypothetical protein [Mycoplasmataceae bacterium]